MRLLSVLSDPTARNSPARFRNLLSGRGWPMRTPNPSRKDISNHQRRIIIYLQVAAILQAFIFVAR